MQFQTKFPALRLKQWVSDWDEYEFDAAAQRRRPTEHIFLFSMSAVQLRQLSDVYRRQRSADEVEGIQRARDENRTDRIRRYVKFGYPYGDLKDALRTEENEILRKPGWLPTAIVINVLTEKDHSRRGKAIAKERRARFRESRDGGFELIVPDAAAFQDDDVRPFEVIDGQHRLWAFDQVSGELPDDFELPVVAFVGLDVAWQAYLFWSINVSPKRINPSHAFDLYPLLRTQDWLEQTGEISVYREARAQEIVEWMFRHEASPWFSRINMLGERGEGRVSQAAWIRSLLGSYLGTGKGKGRQGLFQASVYGQEPLGWSRPQQVAFLIQVWKALESSVREQVPKWAAHYLKEDKDPFDDKSSMLNQDMGLRAVNAATNDLFLLAARAGSLADWSFRAEDDTETTSQDVQRALKSLQAHSNFQLIKRISASLAQFDWRSVDGPKVKGTELEMEKRAYRGSGGYTILVDKLIEHASYSSDRDVANLASTLRRTV